MDRREATKVLFVGTAATTLTANLFLATAAAQTGEKELKGQVKKPVYFVDAYGQSKAAPEITQYYKTDDEVAAWEKLVLETAGLQIDGKAYIAGGGCCCGGGGGMCDAD